MKLQYFYSPQLVSYLIMNDLKLIKTEKHRDTKKTIFYFYKDNRLEEVIEKWRKDLFLKEYLSQLSKVKKMF